MICGRYEGVTKVKLGIADLELSIGDYILTGGEVPAMVVPTALYGFLGNCEQRKSVTMESFEENLLDYPQYTRPEEYRG